jgi:predicted GNAT superfamily acetyltransferase
MLRPEIRSLEKHGEFKECENAQKAIWGGLSVASEVMLVTQKAGGAVLGAFIHGKLVGFIYALLARRDGQISHWSHMMGILPEYRSQGLGLQLKLAHREIALRQGIKSIRWTYDPLQTRNATLNLGKLGARVEEYVSNYYGQFHSTIEQGLPSDRFVVYWPVASRAVGRLIAKGRKTAAIPAVPKVNLTATNQSGFLVNRKVDLGLREPRLLVEIPADADLMRAKALALAKRWRIQTRKIFLAYLSRDYSVRDLLTEGHNTARPRCFYLLVRM